MKGKNWNNVAAENKRGYLVTKDEIMWRIKSAPKFTSSFIEKLIPIPNYEKEK